MRKLYIVFFLLFALASCKENEDFPYAEKDAVYFQLSDTWSTTLDSVVYTFAGKGVKEDTIWVRVNLQGNVGSEARPVKIEVDQERTTAKAGLHYEALKQTYELPAGAVYVRVPVIIYNQDEALEQKAVSITLSLLPSEAFSLGITERLRAKLIVSNMLKKPDYWESNLAYYFGTYSRRKHDICIEVLGMDFPENSADYFADYTAWRIYGKYMSNYFEEHYPIYDENQVPIEPW